MINFFFFGKSVLFDQKKPGDRPGTGEKNSKKIWLDELPARPDWAGPARVSGPASGIFRFGRVLIQGATARFENYLMLFKLGNEKRKYGLRIPYTSLWFGF